MTTTERTRRIEEKKQKSLDKINQSKYPNLKKLRIKSESTQVFFARMIGVTDGQYSRKEQGKSAFTLSECEIIKNFLNHNLKTTYTLDEIFSTEEVTND